MSFYYNFVFITMIWASTAWAVFTELSIGQLEGLSPKNKNRIQRLGSDQTVIRSRAIFVDWGKVHSMANSGSISVDFFKDNIFEGKVNYKRRFYPSGAVYSGKLWPIEKQNLNYGSFTFTFNKKMLSFQAQHGIKMFSVRFVGEGVHLVMEHDPTLFADDVVDRDLPIFAGVPLPARPFPKLRWELRELSKEDKDLGWEDDATRDNGNTFDIMLIYSSSTLEVDADIELQIKLGVGLANTAYFNTHVGTRLRLVHIEQVNYTEQNLFATELNRLSGTADGFNDHIHELRNIYGADFVGLVTSITNEAGVCGIGQLGIDPPDPDRVFHVTKTSCITNQTLTHEVGHNLGLDHQGGGSGVFLFSHGYFVNAGGVSFKTIMSSTACPGCPRQIFFSNPHIHYQGAAAGNVDTANSSYSIKLQAKGYADFREGVVVGNGDTHQDELVGTDCFIATAAYANKYHPDIWKLRRFRDNILIKYKLGQWLVQKYYDFSPPLAKIIIKNWYLRWIAKSFLAPIIFVLKYPLMIIMGIAFIFALLIRQRGSAFE